MRQVGIVLKGTAALGAYEVGVLERFYQDREFHPSIVSGVSIGAINAAVLAGARSDPIDALKSVWDEFAVASHPLIPDVAGQFLGLFSNQTFFDMRLDFMNLPYWTSFYSFDSLRRIIRRYVDFELLNKGEPRLVLTAINVEQGDIEIFDSHEMEITADHIAAAASMPPGFPMVRVNKQFYWGGAPFNARPLVPLFERMDPDQDVEKHIYIVRPFRSQAKAPENMPEVLNRIYDLVLSGKLDRDIRAIEKRNDFIEVMEAIDNALPAKSKIRDMPGYDRLRAYRRIHRLVVVESSDDVLTSAPLDFSASSLEARMTAGYADADAVVAKDPYLASEKPDRRKKT